MSIYPGVRGGAAFVGAEPVPFVDSLSSKDDDRVVLLVHGSGGSAESHFGALFPMLAHRRRVVALDYGCGQECSGSLLTLDHLVAKVVAVIDALEGVDDVDLLGYSLGAAVATAVAAGQPHRVNTLTFVAGWLRTDAHQRLRQDVWKTLSQEAPELLPHLSSFLAVSPDFFTSQPPSGRADLLRPSAGGPDRHRQVELLRDLDIVEVATRVEVPTLIIGGRHDLMAPLAHSKLALGAVPDSRLAVVGSGHAMLMERPAEVYQLFDSFVRDPHRHQAGSHLPAVVV